MWKDQQILFSCCKSSICYKKKLWEMISWDCHVHSARFCQFLSFIKWSSEVKNSVILNFLIQSHSGFNWLMEILRNCWFCYYNFFSNESKNGTIEHCAQSHKRLISSAKNKTDIISSHNKLEMYVQLEVREIAIGQ